MELNVQHFSSATTGRDVVFTNVASTINGVYHFTAGDDWWIPQDIWWTI